MIRLIKYCRDAIDGLYNYLLFKMNGLALFPKVKIIGKLNLKVKGELKIGENTIITSRATANPVGLGTRTGIYVNKGAKLHVGKNVGMSNVLIYAKKEVVIEDDVLLGGSVQVLDSDFHSLQYEYRIMKPDPDIQSAPIRIGKGAFIGANSIVLKGVTIGEKCIIGAGAVVTKSIPAGEIWGGNPAKFIKKLKDFEKK